MKSKEIAFLFCFVDYPKMMILIANLSAKDLLTLLTFGLTTNRSQGHIMKKSVAIYPMTYTII